jgi:hypothetical protein
MNLLRVSKRGSLHGETRPSNPVHLLNRFAAELDSTPRLRHGQEPPGHPALTGPRCASVHGFSLHANTAIPAHRAGPVGAFDAVHRPRCPVA